MLRALDSMALKRGALAIEALVDKVSEGDVDAAIKWLRMRKIEPVSTYIGPTDPDEIINEKVTVRYREATARFNAYPYHDPLDPPSTQGVRRQIETELSEEFSDPEVAP